MTATTTDSKVLVGLSHGPEEPENVLIAYLMAVEALRAGKEAVLWLTKNGVEIAVDGAAEQRVSYTGIRPDLFSEGQGTIATGRLEADLFIATELLAKHDETYMPKEVADALKAQGVFKPSE